MSNITHEVWKYLDDNPCIREVLKLDLINTSALARHLITDKKINGSLDGVIIAIRRYELDKHDEIYTTAKKIFKKTVNISAKSNLAEISLVKDTDVQKILPKLFEFIHYVQGDILRVAQANKSIRLLIDEKYFEKVKQIFPKDKIISEEKELGEINIFIHPDMQNTPGILAVMANELSISGINIIEFMTCPPEMICVVKKEDLINAYDVLYKLCEC